MGSPIGLSVSFVCQVAAQGQLEVLGLPGLWGAGAPEIERQELSISFPLASVAFSPLAGRPVKLRLCQVGYTCIVRQPACGQEIQVILLAVQR